MRHYQVFLTLKGNKAGLSEDMLSACGKKIAAEKGSITVDYSNQVKEACKTAGKPAPSVTLYDNQTATTLAIQSGRIDAGFRSPLAMPVLQKATKDAFEWFKVKQIPTVLLGIATQKDDTAMLDSLLAGLKATQADGTYDQILSKWGVSEVAFKEPGINLVTTNPSAIPQ
jgi:polar amino acid transport system substrate-binding protein